MTRDDLARRQAALLAALVDGGPAPDGFDVDRLAVEADTLRAKRSRVLRRMLDPAVVETLGADLDPHLDRWVRGHPRREGTGFHADADAFVADLRRRGLLPRRRWWRRHPGPGDAERAGVASTPARRRASAR